MITERQLEMERAAEIARRREFRRQKVDVAILFTFLGFVVGCIAMAAFLLYRVSLLRLGVQ